MSQCDEWDKFLGLSHIKKNSKGVLGTSTMTKPTFWSGVEEDGEPISGLTWKLIEEACGVEECGKLRRSARLAQMRDVSDIN